MLPAVSIQRAAWRGSCRGEDGITVTATGRKLSNREFLQADAANSTNAYLADACKPFGVNKRINNLAELEIIGICRSSNATIIARITEISWKEAKLRCGLLLKQSGVSSFSLSGKGAGREII